MNGPWTGVHHSDRGAQNPTIRYTERMFHAGIEPTMEKVGDSFDNVSTESTMGL